MFKILDPGPIERQRNHATKHRVQKRV